jgi:hypothetical protein
MLTTTMLRASAARTHSPTLFAAPRASARNNPGERKSIQALATTLGVQIYKSHAYSGTK